MQKNIRIKLVKPTKEKLKLVKLIKDCSGLGLKEAKDLCDIMHANPEKTVEMSIRDWETIDWSTGVKTPTTTDYRRKFINEIKDVDGKFIVNGGVQWERNVKMLQLGIADKSEYIDFIREYILNSFGNSEDLLTFVLDTISKEDLQEVFNKINIE